MDRKTEGAPPSGQLPIAINTEWQLTDEMTGRFWEAMLSLGKLIVRIVDRLFEVEHPLLTEKDDPLQIYESDKRLLAGSTRPVITKFFKDIGINSVEEADELIANLGGWQVLAVYFGTIAIHYIQEIPDSKGLLRLRARWSPDAAAELKRREDAEAKGAPARISRPAPPLLVGASA